MLLVESNNNRYLEARKNFEAACKARKQLFDQDRLLEQRRIDQKRMSARLKNVEYFELWRNQAKLGLLGALVLALGGIATHNLFSSAVQCDHDLCEQFRFDKRVTRRR